VPERRRPGDRDWRGIVGGRRGTGGGPGSILRARERRRTGANVADTITIIDDRTGKKVSVPITDGAFPSSALRELDPDLRMYDPAFLSTAACSSSITFLDGDAGILRYRGYPIEQLAEQSTYLEVAYLLLNGELPDKEQLATWVYDVTHHTFLHENMRKRFMDGFHYDAHPMGMLVSGVAALSTFYPEAKDIFDADNRKKQILRLIAKMPTLAAYCHRFSVGMPTVYPDNDLSYPANFLNMMWRVGEYEIDPVLEHALDVLFILHADHEQNCGTTAMRVVGSSHADPYSACAAAAAALYGPLHGGANEAVVHMLTEIGSLDNVGDFVQAVKRGEGKLMGFGHRVYKNYDPRATIVKKTAYEVFEITGKNPLLDIALKLEETALKDDYFISRKLYPNVDFYSGLIYQAMGFPIEMFTVLFAIPRTSGWLAHWEELLHDKEQKISRPRQTYKGPGVRDYVPMGERT
jgi:citrate synthase